MNVVTGVELLCQALYYYGSDLLGMGWEGLGRGRVGFDWV